jgi:hypothetical protein
VTIFDEDEAAVSSLVAVVVGGSRVLCALSCDATSTYSTAFKERKPPACSCSPHPESRRRKKVQKDEEKQVASLQRPACRFYPKQVTVSPCSVSLIRLVCLNLCLKIILIYHKFFCSFKPDLNLISIV